MIHSLNFLLEASHQSSAKLCHCLGSEGATLREQGWECCLPCPCSKLDTWLSAFCISFGSSQGLPQFLIFFLSGSFFPDQVTKKHSGIRKMPVGMVRNVLPGRVN